jgi:hypothetical protein
LQQGAGFAAVPVGDVHVGEQAVAAKQRHHGAHDGATQYGWVYAPQE